MRSALIAPGYALPGGRQVEEVCNGWDSDSEPSVGEFWQFPSFGFVESGESNLFLGDWFPVIISKILNEPTVAPLSCFINNTEEREIKYITEK